MRHITNHSSGRRDMPPLILGVRAWYSGILEGFYSNENAGFVILMISFPLIERYLREKSGVHEGQLNDSFYSELQTIFPAIADQETAKQFWHVYRNGLLHQVTLSLKDRKGIKMPTGWLHQDVDLLSIDTSGDFWVHIQLSLQKKLSK